MPETQPVDELLRQLQARRASMAVVLDEYGDFTGVVTVEDVIEEIVGEIDDERDRAPAVDPQPDGRLVVRGHVSLEDLRDHGVELVDETVTSVGGLVFTRLGRLPRTGDTVTGRRLAPHGGGDPRHAGGARGDRAHRAPGRPPGGAGQRVGGGEGLRSGPRSDPGQLRRRAVNRRLPLQTAPSQRSVARAMPRTRLPRNSPVTRILTS